MDAPAGRPRRFRCVRTMPCSLRVEVLGHLTRASVVLVEDGLEDVPASVLVVPNFAGAVYLATRHHVDDHQDEFMVDDLDSVVDLLRGQPRINRSDVVGRRNPALPHLTVDERSELLVAVPNPDDVAPCGASCRGREPRRS